MKKVERLILVLVCVLLLSGCVKMHTTMTINSDKSMVYENEVLFKWKNRRTILVLFYCKKRWYLIPYFLNINIITNWRRVW